MAFHTALGGRGPLLELFFFGRAFQRDGRRLTALDGLGHRVEVAGTDFALVLDRGKAAIGGGEFSFLKFDEGTHLAPRIAVREMEHRVVERVETGQGDELELVASARVLLELAMVASSRSSSVKLASV